MNKSMKKFAKSTMSTLKTNKKVELLITEDFYKKVNYLCTRISEVEWSGVLFYTIEGSLIEETAKVVCKDILPLDKGTSGYTEFKSDERFVEFMMARSEELGEEVFEWQQGLIHSHNTMSVFFSGTDQEELLESCHLYNQYLSLICNNRMEFCAKIARYSEAKLETEDIPFIGLTTSGEKEVVKKQSIDIHKKSIDVYDCEINVEVSKDSMDSLFTGFVDKIMKKVVTPALNGHQKVMTGNWKRPHYNKSFNNFIEEEEDWWKGNSIKNSIIRDEEMEIKKLICEFSGADEFLEDLYLDESTSMLKSISQLLEGFKVPIKEFKLDFIANARTYCSKNKTVDFKTILLDIESFMAENCQHRCPYMIELSKEILKTINNGTRRTSKV